MDYYKIFKWGHIHLEVPSGYSLFHLYVHRKSGKAYSFDLFDFGKPGCLVYDFGLGRKRFCFNVILFSFWFDFGEN